MGKLTKKQALEDCIVLWQHLADNPADTKINAVEIVLPGKHYISNCPCCEYSLRHNGLRPCATRCIISWPGGHCQTYASPYHSWCTVPYAKSTKYALEIVKLAKEALAKLEEL